ncbi:uncharacterized protein DMAD_05570 [Drosophila madeirensis]|uniref:Uncharacterized protein n=1 Tax=Drosophila madeirensis TaxID=30013 RepID=A0AAU9FNI9_DROMD
MLTAQSAGHGNTHTNSDELSSTLDASAVCFLWAGVANGFANSRLHFARHAVGWRGNYYYPYPNLNPNVKQKQKQTVMHSGVLRTVLRERPFGNSLSNKLLSMLPAGVGQSSWSSCWGTLLLLAVKAFAFPCASPATL